MQQGILQLTKESILEKLEVCFCPGNKKGVRILASLKCRISSTEDNAVTGENI